MLLLPQLPPSCRSLRLFHCPSTLLRGQVWGVNSLPTNHCLQGLGLCFGGGGGGKLGTQSAAGANGCPLPPIPPPPKNSVVWGREPTKMTQTSLHPLHAKGSFPGPRPLPPPKKKKHGHLEGFLSRHGVFTQTFFQTSGFWIGFKSTFFGHHEMGSKRLFFANNSNK